MHLDGIAMPGSGLQADYGASDDVLAKATRAGDPEAFAALYHRHVGAVADLVARWVPYPSLRADYVQEIFASALTALTTGSYRPSWTPEGFAEWLTDTVAIDVFADDKRAFWAAWRAQKAMINVGRAEIFGDRRAARTGGIDVNAPGVNAYESMREHLEAEAAADARQALARQRVCDLLGSCSPKDRRVLELHYLEGLTVEETAAALGCTPASVKGLLVRAFGHVRNGTGSRPKGRTIGSGAIYQKPPRKGHPNGEWCGYVHVAAPDGATRRRYVYGRDRSDVQAKWDRLRAEVTTTPTAAVAA
jgi:RNA polymerase sigma-70 factor, ECF subfamily